ncbi:MAG: DUF2970 domain-containing protein [Gammaproteobacteria bacterium]|jgi:hypothetical protein
MSEEDKVGLGRVVMSVLAAMFGVQGARAHERDFTKGRPAAYVIVGLIFTLLFILTIVGVVTLVMHFSAS